MAIYVISGATTGIGAAVKGILLEQGHRVINIDIADGDITADLADRRHRKRAISELIALCPEGIDCFVANAGVGPTEEAPLIVSLNYFAAREMCEAFYPLLLKRRGNIVVTSSNSANLPGHNDELIAAMADENDEDRATEIASALSGFAKQQAYQGSKYAIAKWVRRQSASWAARGVRINAVCPGCTDTALRTKCIQDPVFSAGIKHYPLPIGFKDGVNYLQADQIAQVIVFMSGSAGSVLSGSVIYADGGCDALLRSERF